MAFESLDDVFVDQLKDLFSAEKQLVKALPKLVKAASDARLKEAVQEHLAITRSQVDRLARVFLQINQTPKPKRCKGMEGLIEECKEALGNKKASDNASLDAAIICAAQRIEHYEISAYGSTRSFAEALGYSEAVEILQEILDEESDANETLTDIARQINVKAAKGARGAGNNEAREVTNFVTPRGVKRRTRVSR